MHDTDAATGRTTLGGVVRNVEVPAMSTGGCLCGDVRYACDSAPLWQAHCHCESCRRACSAPFTSFFGMADGAWRWTGRQPALHRSSPGVERFFCPTCGSPMAYRSSRWPGEMHFYAASLDDPASFAATEHVHWDEHLPWLHLNDGLPRK